MIDCCNSWGAFWTLFTFAFLGICVIALVLHRWIAKPRAADFEQHHGKIYKDEKLSSNEEASCAKFANDLYDELRLRGIASLRAVAVFSEYHYVAIIGATLSGSLAGVAAFVIAAFGWDGANRALQGFFVGCAGSLSFWLTVIQVFKYPEIIAKHETIYTACGNLIGELRLAQMGLPLEPADNVKVECGKLLQSIAQRAQALRAIGISFDSSKIRITKIEPPA